MKNNILSLLIIIFFISCSDNKYCIFSNSECNENILFLLGLMDDYGGHFTKDRDKLCAEFYKSDKNRIYYFENLSRIILKDKKIKESLKKSETEYRINFYNSYLKQLINSFYDLKLHYSQKRGKINGIYLKEEKIYIGIFRKDFLDSLTFEEGKFLLAGIFVDRYINSQLHIFSLTYTFEYLNNKYGYFKYKKILRPEGIKGWIVGDPEHFIIYDNKITVEEIQKIGRLLLKEKL